MTKPITHLFKRGSFEKTKCGYFRKNMDGTHRKKLTTCPKCRRLA